MRLKLQKLNCILILIFLSILSILQFQCKDDIIEYYPVGTITSPDTDREITQYSKVYFKASAEDYDNDLPLSYHWIFGEESGIEDSYDEEPGSITFNRSGEFVVTLIVTDSVGISDGEPDSVTITVNAKAPESKIVYPEEETVTICKGDSISFEGEPVYDDMENPSFLWTFGEGSGIEDSTAQNPSDIVFNNLGSFIVTFTVSDYEGNSDPEPDNVTINVIPAFTFVRHDPLTSPAKLDGRCLDLIDASHGYGIGMDGEIIKLETDGTWSLVSGTEDTDLNYLALADANNGWAVGDEELWKLESGVWSDASASMPSNSDDDEMIRVFLYDADNGWAIGYDDDYDTVLWKLESGTWTRQSIDFDIYDIALTNNTNTGWAVGRDENYDYCIFQLSSGTFSNIQNSSCILCSLDIVSTDGYAVGYECLYEFDTNTWTELSIPDPSAYDVMYEVELIDANTGWAVGANYDYDYGAVWKLESGTWSSEPNVSAVEEFFELELIDANNGKAIGYDYYEDSYECWDLISGSFSLSSNPFPGIMSETDIFAIDIVDADTGWAVGEYALWQLTDGEWSYYIEPPSEDEMNDICIIDEDTGWAVGYDALWQLSGGAWTNETPPSYDDMYDIELVDADNGWAVGYDGVIWKLESGTWSEYSSSFTYSIYWLELDDAQNGWASNYIDLLRLEDGVWSTYSHTDLHDGYFFALDIPGTNQLMVSTIEYGIGMTIFSYNNGDWEVYFEEEDAYSYLKDICLEDLEKGWGISSGTPVQLYKGSLNILEDMFEDYPSMTDLEIIDMTHGWFVGYDGEVWQLLP